MIEMRFHGRGGQGTVKGCQVLAKALIQGGYYAQFIPAFGVERKGSPVYGYFRLDDKKIRLNCQVYQPDIVVVSDSSLLESVPVFDGMRPGGRVVINFKDTPDALHAPAGVSVTVVNATDLAQEAIGAPIPNTVMLGAVASVLPSVDRSLLRKEIADVFGDKNAIAFDSGFEKAVTQ